MFNIKHETKWKMKHFMARLVANYFTQTYGVEHNENFTSLAKKIVSIHYILAILTLEDMESIKLNENKISTKNLKKKFTWNNLKDSHNNVWKLDKSLYGSNNLKEHGTKKLNAFREIMDL